MKSDDAGQRRAREVERYAALDLPARRDLQPLVELAAKVCDAPVATITLAAEKTRHHLATAGAADGSALGPILPEPVLETPDVVVVEDVGLDDRFTDRTSGSATVFEASAPLVSSEGVVIGRLCVVDARPRQLDETQVELLEMLAGRAMGVLQLTLCSLELEESRRELAEAREEAARSRDHLSLFAGQVSHDLRTPLTAISANAEMLSTEPAVTQDADLTWMVAGIDRAAKRLNTMIEHMLDYARQGGAPVVSATSLTTVFELALADLAPVVRESAAEVTVGRLPTLQADPDQMYAVALNLLTNAVRFARPDTPPRVVVAADRLDGRWRITVTDNGIGVPADKQETMFVLFARVDKRLGGSGVGLSMARRVIEAHGGRTGMHDAPGGGTTVWFELPV